MRHPAPSDDADCDKHESDATHPQHQVLPQNVDSIQKIFVSILSPASIEIHWRCDFNDPHPVAVSCPAKSGRAVIPASRAKFSCANLWVWWLLDRPPSRGVTTS